MLASSWNMDILHSVCTYFLFPLKKRRIIILFSSTTHSIIQALSLLINHARPFHKIMIRARVLLFLRGVNHSCCCNFWYHLITGRQREVRSGYLIGTRWIVKPEFELFKIFDMNLILFNMLSDLIWKEKFLS